MHLSRGREAMSTDARRSKLYPLYGRSRSAWTCLLRAFPKLPVTLPFWRWVDVEPQASVAPPSPASLQTTRVLL
jgi:hypothetical protein